MNSLIFIAASAKTTFESCCLVVDVCRIGVTRAQKTPRLDFGGSKGANSPITSLIWIGNSSAGPAGSAGS